MASMSRMWRCMTLLTSAAAMIAAQSTPQLTYDPFPTPIEATAGVIAVSFVEFATLPDVDGEAPRMMHFVDEPGTKRHRSSARCAACSTASATTARRVTPYLDINAPKWGVGVQSQGARARLPELRVPPAVQPSAARQATASSTPTPTPPNIDAEARLRHRRRNAARTTRCCSSGRRRIRRPRPTTAARRASCSAPRSRSPITTAGRSRFNPLAAPGSADFGLLYIGFADGGSGGDPFNLAQNLSLGVRQDPAHRPARDEQRQRQVRHSGRAIRSSRTASPTRSARSTPTACATRSASPGMRRPAACSSPTSARTSSRRSAR